MGLLLPLRPLTPAAILAAGLFCFPAPSSFAEPIEVDFEAVELIGGVVAAAEPDAAEPDDGKGDAEDATEAAPDAEPLTPGDQILANQGFDPREPNYAERAASLFLGKEELADVRQRIIDLDDDDFRARNEASKHLAMVEAPIEHLLGVARASAEIEMARRIQSVLNVRLKKRPLDALYHAAGKIAIDQEAGFVDGLLTIASTFRPEHHWELLRMFEYALARSAREQDEERLAEALTGDDPSGREMAAFALGYRGGARGEQDSRTKIPEDDHIALLAAARGRAAAGGTAPAEELIALLGSDSVRVRHEAGVLLRALFDKDFAFAGYDPAELREAAAGRWKNFVGNAPTPLEPVRLGAAARGTFNVLVGKKPGKSGGVLKYTTSGDSDGDHPLSSTMGGADPDSITFDDTAGLVVASGGADANGRITVLNTEGHELWSVSGFPAEAGCAALPGGGLLVAVGQEVEQLEVTGDRTGVWDLGAEIAAFHKLREARYLCCHPETGEIAEYGADGEPLWRKDGFHHPTDVSRLPGGNLLIAVRAGERPDAEAGEKAGAATGNPILLETSPDGRETVATIRPKGVRSITSAARLPNGNTLIGTEKGLAEYTPEGFAIKVWIKTPISSLHVR